jgi:hypothetical protein
MKLITLDAGFLITWINFPLILREDYYCCPVIRYGTKLLLLGNLLSLTNVLMEKGEFYI